MKRSSAGAIFGAVAGFAHVLPTTTAWRSARCRFTPHLAGVGRADHVALTFDDGPDPASTPAFLDVLDSLDVKATFFMLGEMAAKSPALTAEVAARGHEIAVHGYKHHNHLRHSAFWTSSDIVRARDTLENLTGTCPRWFRPPYGVISGPTVIGVRHAQLQTVLWTTWGRDWTEEVTPRSVIDEIESTWHPGATVLLHDSDCTSASGSWKSSLQALPELVERWRSDGLVVGPLADHELPLKL